MIKCFAIVKKNKMKRMKKTLKMTKNVQKVVFLTFFLNGIEFAIYSISSDIQGKKKGVQNEQR
jgi:hypothetical protein